MPRWARRGLWLEYRVGQAEAGQTLGALLTDGLGVSARLVRELAAAGALRLGQAPARLAAPVAAGERVGLGVFLPEPYGVAPEPVPFGLLYEDDHLLVADKPGGVLVHPPVAPGTGTLANGVAYHYQSRGIQARVRHVHRLDVGTTGTVLFARHAVAHVLLDAALAAHRIRREYVAVVAGQPRPARGTLSWPLGRDRHRAGRYRVHPGGVPAVTHYQVLEAYAHASLVHLRLETGRTHQIRVHMAHAGHPLLGDTLYGGPARGMGRQALHGSILTLDHPFTGEPLVVTAPWPADFAALVAALRAGG